MIILKLYEYRYCELFKIELDNTIPPYTYEWNAVQTVSYSPFLINS